MINEVKGSPGNWSLKLKSSTPLSVLDLITFGSNVWVVPNYVGGWAPTHYEFVNNGPQIYGGLVFKKSARKRSIGGVNMLGYLVTGKGVANGDTISGGQSTVYEKLTFPANFGQVVQAIFNPIAVGFIPTWYSNGLQVASVAGCDTSAALTAPSDLFRGIKDTVDEWAKVSGNDWYVDPGGWVYASTPANLWTNTGILISPDIDVNGWENGTRQYTPTSWDAEGSVESLRNCSVGPQWNGSGYSRYSVSMASAKGWRNLRPLDDSNVLEGSFAHYGCYAAQYFNDNYDDVPSIPDGVAGPAAILATARQYAEVDWRVRCSINADEWPTLVRPGDSIHITDAVEGIDEDLMVQSHSWPVKEGMGVYISVGSLNQWTRFNGISFPTVNTIPEIDVIDITPWVEFENEGTTSVDLARPVALTMGSRPKVASYR